MLDVLEEFICHLRGHVNQNDVHEVVKLYFEEKLNLTTLKDP